MAWVVTFWSMISIFGSAPGDGFPVVAEGDGLAVLGGLGQVGVGVDQVVRAGVLREEGQHAARTLRPGGHVVLFQGGIVAPRHHGVKIQVENRLAGWWPGPLAIICLSRAARNVCWWSWDSR